MPLSVVNIAYEEISEKRKGESRSGNRSMLDVVAAMSHLIPKVEIRGFIEF